MERRLYRSTKEKYIAGVCGGLGEYFGVDPAFIRILFVLLTFANGFGLLAYLILWITVRKRPEGVAVQTVEHDSINWTKYLAGGILILLGVIFFIHENVYWFDIGEVWEKFWPVVLIALGLVLVLYRGKSSESIARNDYSTQREQNGGSHI